MRFDFASFSIGAIVAFVVSFVAYKRRERLSALWQKIRARFGVLKIRLTASVEQSYRTALLAYCDQLVLTKSASHFACHFFSMLPGL